MAMRALVTGSRSGFGKFACSQLGAQGLTRENSDAVLAEGAARGFDLIIHCANDDKNSVLLEKLLNISHKNFVFLSSCDVYPDDALLHTEGDQLNPLQARNDYAKEKIQIEAQILLGAKLPFLIRTVSLLGEGQCGANLKKLLNDETPDLTLTPDSTWNFVTHSEVLAAIRLMVEAGFSGPLNFCSSESVCVKEVASFFNKKATYGNFHYHVGNINNNLAVKNFPFLNRFSMDVLKNWRLLNS